MPYRRLEVAGGFTLLDEEDYHYFSKWRWFKHQTGYVQRAKKINGKWKTIRLHVEILRPKEGFQTDHINRDRSDNRRSNLRQVTASQNCHNKKMRKDNKTGYIGIWFRNDTKKWTARIVVEGERKVLGCFVDKKEAVEAYTEAKESYVRSQGL